MSGGQPSAPQRIDTAAFESSNLRSGVFDDRDGTMTITFVDGRTYVYRNVPQGVWEGLKAAGSPGSYFYQQVRGRYGGTEV